jgi:glycosyltransferase involved in cell wall biosynthesis
MVMKVLHLIPGNLYGGVETFLVALARYQGLCPGLGHRFVLCHAGRLSQELCAEQAAVQFVPPARLSRPWTVYRTRRALAALLRECPCDLVISHQIWPLLVFGPAVREACLPLVLYVHGPIPAVGWMEWWASRRRPDLVIGVSRYTLETARHIYPRVPGEVIHYPAPWPASAFRLSAGERKAVRNEFQAPEGAVVILQASRMEPWKGQDLTIAALGRLRDVPGWVCWMAGGCQRPAEVYYHDALRRQAERLGLHDRVRFLGERRDVRRLMGAADVYCQGNRGPEGFGLAFLEAFSSGLPVVTSALGAALELIDDGCGRLVPAGDVDALALALRTLLADPGLRRQLGAAALRRVPELSDPTRQLTRVHEVLSKVRGVAQERCGAS